ncbi:uncharacterized protein NPIL_21941 [Nephila pilipes]|uniref:Uncharacterized protein n=1 Tax=Nephila pilipes TaxID=299642 RepID=A0A8X6I667_NEPPI|nr:uncharacterized protein NPIL_21941 [Nephila pilipes]
MIMAISPVHKNISTEWIEESMHNQGKFSDSEETIIFELDNDSKIKPEVELKEETDNFIYKTDFRGHLQLVSLTHGNPIPNINQTDSNRQWPDVKSSSKNGLVTISWQEESEDSNTNNLYENLKNGCSENYCFKDEDNEKDPLGCSYVHSLPEIYDYSSDSTWHPQSDISSQLTRSLNLNRNMILLTQAEKKRLYRLRIKEENPVMWSTIKKKEAARKREQREKRRHIIFEMQKAMELSELPESPEVVNQKLYLETLKESYPELWSQLINALPATQMRNDQIYNERSSKSRRHFPKPARMYKDVIEAQKKRIYRQKIKEERPEMYERQKARDAYARSIQRLMVKKKRIPHKTELHSKSHDTGEVETELAYLESVKVVENLYVNSKSFPSHLMDHKNNQNDDSDLQNSNNSEVPGHITTEILSQNPEITTAPTAPGDIDTKSDLSQICDNNPSMDNYNHSKLVSLPIDFNISSHVKSENSQKAIDTSTFSENVSSTACSTQSDILWYWNDVKSNQSSSQDEPGIHHIPYASWRKAPQSLTQEERMQKILKEQMNLREKRKQIRMSMSSEKRTEFLEVERERLKAYRLKKKIAEMAMVTTIPNQITCVDQ